MMNEKHSSVCYIFREGAFSPVREAKPFRNDFCLDLFQYKGAVYEGRTGLQFRPLKQAVDIASFIEKLVIVLLLTFNNLFILFNVSISSFL